MLTDIKQQVCSEPLPKSDKLYTAQTIEYGIQVDLNYNPEIPQNGSENSQNQENDQRHTTLSAAQRRKMNKKNSKKRKRQKEQEAKREARRQIGNIIQQFYERTACFQDYKDKIKTLIELVYNNDFRDYLDQLIRMRVTVIQKSIWEYTQSILDDNPFETNEDHAFYGLMVDYIFQRYLQLRESSEEIQKIINVYLRYTYHKTDVYQQMVYNNLAINTFNYMIETDDTLRNLLHICQKKLPVSKTKHLKRLKQLTNIILYFEQQRRLDEEDEMSCPNDDHMSTGLSEEDDTFLERKRRKKKVKDSELTTTEETLTQRLQNLSIREQERASLHVSEGWLRKMRLRAVKYKMS